MLGDKMLIGTYTVTDLDRAVAFYTEKLGLKLERKGMGDANLSAGMGSMIDLYTKPNSTSGNTAATFMVDDLESEMAELRGKGVMFEEYDIPEMKLKTENGIATWDDGTRAAWFKDSEGNILSLISMEH